MSRPGWSLVALLLWLGATLAPAAEEAALQQLYQKQLAAPDDHEAAIKACAAFRAEHAADALVPVVQGLEAWHHLRAGRPAEATRLLEPALTAPASPVADGARMMAQGWLTRLDREKCVTALQAYYRKQIAYPKSYDAMITRAPLTVVALPPAADRFGKPWAYSLIGFGKVKGFDDQKYALQSTTLGDLSELSVALKLPYATTITATPTQVVAAPGNAVAVRFALGGGKAAALGVGQASGTLHLAYVGASLIVVCDPTHWKVFSKP